jgi:hypothetical protein
MYLAVQCSSARIITLHCHGLRIGCGHSCEVIAFLYQPSLIATLLQSARSIALFLLLSCFVSARCSEHIISYLQIDPHLSDQQGHGDFASLDPCSLSVENVTHFSFQE